MNDIKQVIKASIKEMHMYKEHNVEMTPDKVISGLNILLKMIEENEKFIAE